MVSGFFILKGEEKMGTEAAKPASYDDAEVTTGLLVEEQQVESSDQTNANGESEKDQTRLFKYGEEELARDALIEKLDDDTLDNILFAHENKSNWEKSNTQKAQEAADRVKSIQPLMDFRSKLKTSPELQEALDDVWKDLTKSEESIAAVLIQEELDSIPNPFKEELEQALERADTVERETRKKAAAAEIEQETQALQKPFAQGGYALTDRQVNAVAVKVMERFKKDGVMRSLEEVLKLDHPEWTVKKEAIQSNHGNRASSASTKKDLPKSLDDVPLSAFAGIIE